MSLSDKELTDIRDVADDWLPDTCTIQTRTESVDGLGGISYSWVNTYESVNCRLDPASLSGDERVMNEALEGESFWILTVAYDQALTVEDRIRHNSRQYEVREVNDTNSFLIVRDAILVRVEPGTFTEDAFSSGFDTGFS